MSTLNNFGSIGPTFVASIPLQKSPRFLFVTISNPDEIREPTKQTIIRRHAQRDADRARKRSHKIQAENLMLDVATLEQYSHKTSRKTRKPMRCRLSLIMTFLLSGSTTNLVPWHSWDHLVLVLGFTPFAPYPVELNSRKTQLLDYCMLYSLNAVPVGVSS